VRRGSSPPLLFRGGERVRVVMKRIAVNLSEFQLERLRRLSALRGVPYSELIRRAVDEFLDRELGRPGDEVNERASAEISP